MFDGIRLSDSNESREKRRSTGEVKEVAPDATEDVDSGRLVRPFVSMVGG